MVDINADHKKESDQDLDELYILAEYIAGGSIEKVLSNFKSFKEQMIVIYIK